MHIYRYDKLSFRMCSCFFVLLEFQHFYLLDPDPHLSMQFWIQETFYNAWICIKKGPLDLKPHGEMWIRIRKLKFF